MGEILQLDYYYGIEAEQFSFYRVPRLLIKDERFKKLSSDAKLLYGLMLDRMSLSMKNEWFDDENRAYIIYTIDSIMEDLGCAKEKAVLSVMWWCFIRTERTQAIMWIPLVTGRCRSLQRSLWQSIQKSRLRSLMKQRRSFWR